MGSSAPSYSDWMEISPGMAPRWGTTECIMWIIHLRTLSSQSVYRSSALISIPCRGFHYRLRRARASRSRHVLAHPIRVLLLWHPRPQICASVYDVRAAFRSLHSAVGKLQPVRWWLSGIGGRLVYRLLFYVLLATGRCVSPGMGCSSPPCLGPMGFGLLDYCYTGLRALWLRLRHMCH